MLEALAEWMGYPIYYSEYGGQIQNGLVQAMLLFIRMVLLKQEITSLFLWEYKMKESGLISAKKF